MVGILPNRCFERERRFAWVRRRNHFLSANSAEKHALVNRGCRIFSKQIKRALSLAVKQIFDSWLIKWNYKIRRLSATLSSIIIWFYETVCYSGHSISIARYIHFIAILKFRNEVLGWRGPVGRVTEHDETHSYLCCQTATN